MGKSDEAAGEKLGYNYSSKNLFNQDFTGLMTTIIPLRAPNLLANLPRRLFLFLIVLLAIPTGFAADTEENDKSNSEPPMDWSRTAVSRGFGQVPEPGELQPALMQALKAGQVSYFFGDFKQALVQWEPLAEKGLADAQANVGWLYQSGRGVKQNYEKALFWYQKAAAQEQAVAQNNLGVLFEYGYGVTKDLAQARQWYRKSAEQGYRFGQYNLAQLILNANAEKHDEAIHWLKQAAAQGVAQASAKLTALGIAVDAKTNTQ